MSDGAWVRPHQEIYDDLGGVNEIAKALGVSNYLVRRWIERREKVLCPEPVAIIDRVHVFSIADWKGWYAWWKYTRAGHRWAKDPPAKRKMPPKPGQIAPGAEPTLPPGSTA